MSASSDGALRFVEVVKEYRLGASTVRALDGVSLTVPQGQFLAVTGRSGSGKSTLLNLAAGIDVPTSGQIWIEGTELSRLSDDVLTRLRRDRIGVIYQFFNLISTLTVRENVALPAELAGRPAAAARAAADRLIDEVDLGARRDARPHALGRRNAARRDRARWRSRQRWCWPTSPPATWTRARPTRCWGCCGWWRSGTAPRWCW